MKLKPKMKMFLVLGTWTASVATVLVLLGFASKQQEELRCKEVNIKIDEVVNHEFVDRQDILGLINSKGIVTGKPLGSINTALLEKIILSNPYVDRAEVYSSIDGTLHADVWQRNPVVRIINMHDEQFYIVCKSSN